MIWAGLVFSLFSVASASTAVLTQYGPVLGHVVSNGVQEWLGIQYAAAPVGNLRFADPAAPPVHSSVFDASFVAPGCPQECALPPGSCPETISEDCLYLNVWSPAGASNLPVFVWIHGGAFLAGAAYVPLYWGHFLAEMGIVVVTLNYRMGAFGFYATESLSGNWGIKDQRFALEWVQKNIAGFGGNPNDVTIAGQSAGAMSVGCHLASPASAGLFHKAILESNPWALPYKTSEEAEDMAEDVAKYAGCRVNDLNCLRSLSMDEVLDAQDNGWKINRDMWFDNFVPWGPVVDGSYLPMQPFYAVRSGQFNQVPLLTGSMSEDGVMFVYELFTSELGSAAYSASLNLIFGRANTREIEDYYPADMFGNSDDTRDVVSQLGSDLLFACADMNATIGASSSTGVKVWSFFFTEVLSFEEAWGPDYTFCDGRVCHGSELPYVFEAFTDGVTTYYPTADEKKLLANIMGYWVNFVIKGDPNGNDVPYWPEFSSSGQLLVLNEPTSYVSNLRQQYCSLWNDLGYFW